MCIYRYTYIYIYKVPIYLIKYASQLEITIYQPKTHHDINTRTINQLYTLELEYTKNCHYVFNCNVLVNLETSPKQLLYPSVHEVDHETNPNGQIIPSPTRGHSCLLNSQSNHKEDVQYFSGMPLVYSSCCVLTNQRHDDTPSRAWRDITDRFNLCPSRNDATTNLYRLRQCLKLVDLSQTYPHVWRTMDCCCFLAS